MKHIPNNHFLRTRTFAHRGLKNKKKGIVENTLESCMLAVQYGYGIEIDVRITKYGTVILLHDSNIKRLTGIDKNYYDLTDNDLKNIRYKNSKCKIATLKEVLQYINGKVPILIELKPDSIFKRTKELVNAVNKLLIDYNGEYAIQSFFPNINKIYKKVNPNILIGLVAPLFLKKQKFLNNILVCILLKEYKYDFLVYNINFMPNEYIRRLKIPKIFWNVNNKEREKKALKNDGNIIWNAYEDSNYLAPRRINKL